MDKDNVFMSCLGMILATISLMVIGMVMNGWALSTIWNWFVPPIFGLTTLTFGKAIGIGMVAKLFTGTYNFSKSNNDTKNKTFTDVFAEGLSVSILTPLLTVGFAWIVLQIAF